MRARVGPSAGRQNGSLMAATAARLGLEVVNFNLGPHPTVGTLDFPMGLTQRMVFNRLPRGFLNAVLVSNLVDDSVSTACVARCHNGLHLLLRSCLHWEGRRATAVPLARCMAVSGESRHARTTYGVKLLAARPERRLGRVGWNPVNDSVCPTQVVSFRSSRNPAGPLRGGYRPALGRLRVARARLLPSEELGVAKAYGATMIGPCSLRRRRRPLQYRARAAV
jgi:hypothetical protein